jgi:hypothetical protein
MNKAIAEYMVKGKINNCGVILVEKAKRGKK